MKKIGVTGGIGSGKSLVCSVFEHLGVPVYYADERARLLMQESGEIRKALTSLLGRKAYRQGELNKPFVARILFDDPHMREQINKIVHPVVFDDFLKWTRNFSDRDYVIEEAAIIFESGADRFLDKVINVYAPVKERIARLTLRDGENPEDIRKRIHSQMTEKERRQRADFIIINDGKRMLLPQILKIHKSLLN